MRAGPSGKARWPLSSLRARGSPDYRTVGRPRDHLERHSERGAWRHLSSIRTRCSLRRHSSNVGTARGRQRFALQSTHYLARELTESAIRFAMADAGHEYVAYDWLCDPRGFTSSPKTIWACSIWAIRSGSGTRCCCLRLSGCGEDSAFARRGDRREGTTPRSISW